MRTRRRDGGTWEDIVVGRKGRSIEEEEEDGKRERGSENERKRERKYAVRGR